MNILINLKDFLYYNRKIIAIVTFLLFCSFFFLFYDVRNSDDSQIIFEEKDVEVEKKQVEENVKNIKTIFVDVKGFVKNPGIYELTENDRVLDAINKAGGLLDYADTSSINLSMHLIDEMVIVVEGKKEEGENKLNSNVVNELTYNSKTPSLYYSVDSNNGNNNNARSTKVSINKASLSELMSIKGIGEVKAKNIIDYRDRYGQFQKLEDLKNVNGIGNTTYEKIKDYLTL